VKKKMAAIKKVDAENMLLGNGSDECIDLVIRAFCNPQQDNIIICPPTYGMYEVYAAINDVPVKEVPLTPAFQLDLEALEEAVDAATKVIFFCSPNNPTGNSMDHEAIEMVLNNFDGIVVVDEAYINYSRSRSFVASLGDYPNLVVMQTFSKAWGLAALRLGMIFASTEIVAVLNKIKPPYNINGATQELALKALDNLEDVNTMINGNDGGINITYDNGEHWTKANSPAVGQFYSVTVDNAKPYNVYGGLQDNGVWYGPSTNEENPYWQASGDYPFKSIMGGDGMQVQVDTRDNTTTYTGFQFGNYSRLNRSQPRGTAKRIMPLHPMGEKPYRFNWQSPILLSPHNQDVVYFGGNQFFRSMNKADTMFAMGDLTRGDKGGNVPFGTLTTITESPLRFGLIYAGTDDGNIQLTKDGGYTWTLVNNKPAKVADAPLAAGLWVSRVAASKFKEARVYVTLNGYRHDDFAPYLYVSEDYGSTWTQLGRDLPLEPINVVREDPKNENILYVGTDGGLYVSFNRGKSFMTWNGGMPKAVPVHDIAIQERENEIVLGTHGRSLYVAGLTDVQGVYADKDYLKKKAEKEKSKAKPKTDDDDDRESEVD